MNIQTIQLLQLAAYIILFLIVIYAPKKMKVASVIVIIIMFALNPFRSKQIGGQQIERDVVRFNSVPEKIVVEQKEFDQFHKEELNKLKQESGDLKDEIHN